MVLVVPPFKGYCLLDINITLDHSVGSHFRMVHEAFIVESQVSTALVTRSCKFNVKSFSKSTEPSLSRNIPQYLITYHTLAAIMTDILVKGSMVKKMSSDPGIMYQLGRLYR
ncbi:hypothetical protein AVEN_225186-1 [Araneus ventricosus]|uniref:Uncharacterized protein n=1 Tax=Araneus ventricosus TaxID=182803 RepID=A0A4Y2AKR2_ARAVE|nr:hypothetical protein AVEN_225186-1 [Araneus ventricosus]